MRQQQRKSHLDTSVTVRAQFAQESNPTWRCLQPLSCTRTNFSPHRNVRLPEKNRWLRSNPNTQSWSLSSSSTAICRNSCILFSTPLLLFTLWGSSFHAICLTSTQLFCALGSFLCYATLSFSSSGTCQLLSHFSTSRTWRLNDLLKLLNYFSTSGTCQLDLMIFWTTSLFREHANWTSWTVPLSFLVKAWNAFAEAVF